MNYLAICQRAAQESGTVSGTGLPAAVTGQTETRMIKIVSWVAQAWIDIQNMHSAWRWLRAEFTGTTTASSARYTAASWSIDSRFGEWITEPHSVTMYLTATGVSDEGEIPFVDWQTWRMKYSRGTQTNNRPIEYTISPANEFCLGPTPDDTYTIRAEYRKSPQVLAANTDTPECPSRFHNIIWRRALMLLHAHDEGLFPLANMETEYLRDLEDLERDQMPMITIASEPIA